MLQEDGRNEKSIQHVAPWLIKKRRAKGLADVIFGMKFSDWMIGLLDFEDFYLFFFVFFLGLS